MGWGVKQHPFIKLSIKIIDFMKIDMNGFTEQTDLRGICLVGGKQKSLFTQFSIKSMHESIITVLYS